MDEKNLFDKRYVIPQSQQKLKRTNLQLRSEKTRTWIDERIYEYLKTEGVSEEDSKQLAKSLNINC